MNIVTIDGKIPTVHIKIIKETQLTNKECKI